MLEFTNIYSLKSTRDLSDIRYIGKTNSNIYNRLHEHLRKTSNVTHKDNWIRKEIRDGYKIKIELIDIVYKEDWEFWEMYYIYKYRKEGYNLTNIEKGGMGIGNYSNQSNKVPIIALSFRGKILNKFSSIREVSGYYNIPENAIRDHVAGRHKSCRGKIFVKESEYDPNKDYSLKRNKKATTIYQYTLEGDFVKKWDRIVDAAKYYGISKALISAAATNKQRSAGNFQWSYKYKDKMENIESIIKKEVKLNVIKDSIIVLKDKTINEISELLNLNKKGISKCLYRPSKYYKGYYFERIQQISILH